MGLYIRKTRGQGSIYNSICVYKLESYRMKVGQVDIVDALVEAVA